jgi:hypothetical protein
MSSERGNHDVILCNGYAEFSRSTNPGTFCFAMPHHPKPQGFVQLRDAEGNVDGEKFINELVAAEPARSYKEQLQQQRHTIVVRILSTQS